VLGYQRPDRPEAMFVWQIGIHPKMRGQGLASALLLRFSNLPAYRECRYLEATVGTSNQASRALFQRFARTRQAGCEIGEGFPKELFPEGHEAEDLFRIGPLKGKPGAN
jgi:L-2,4-diaminobutyric acid acetyltransferase